MDVFTDDLQTASLLKVPDQVRRETMAYGSEVDRFLRGELAPIEFSAYAAAMGVYEHRERGRFMTRIRLGAGLVRADQLDRIADLSDELGDGIVHATTRQDLQLHGLSAEGTVRAQQRLLAMGLVARGGGGNTLRNVTACPRASVCPQARFDVAPYAIAVAEHLLAHPHSVGLPRKFKIAFSGCGDDCAFASVTDVGFFAKDRGREPGFAVYAAGGLGTRPGVGTLVETFIPATEVFRMAESLLTLFHRLGDRTNRRQARLRFVLDRLGTDGFLAEYEREKARLTASGLHAQPPAIRSLPFACVPGEVPFQEARMPEGFWAERDPGRFTLVVRLSGGNLPSADLRKVAGIVRDLGMGVAIVTQQQDLAVPGIPAGKLAEARQRLGTLSFDARALSPKVVACTGARTCKLGIGWAPALAKEIERTLSARNDRTSLPEMRVSGCPNQCANHGLAELGFEGRLKRHEDKAVPSYDVFLGGRVTEGQARLGQRLGTLPSKVVPRFIADLAGLARLDPETVQPILDRHATLPNPIPDDFYVDWGRGPAFLGP